MSVQVSSPIDLPDWNPSRRPNRAAEVKAWQRSLTGLRAHEIGHRQIANEWGRILQGRVQATGFTVTGTDKKRRSTRGKKRDLTDAFRNGLTMSKMNRTCLIRKQITVGTQLHQLIVHESKDDYQKSNIKMITIVRIVRMEIYTT